MKKDKKIDKKKENKIFNVFYKIEWKLIFEWEVWLLLCYFFYIYFESKKSKSW